MHPMRAARTGALAVLAVLLLAAGLAGQAHAATFAPVADAPTRAEYPDTNYGTSTGLRVDGSPVARSYLKFDVAGLTRTVRKATLRVYARTAASSPGVELQPAGSAWGETTLTARNAPAPGAVATRSAAFAAGTWVSLNVTSLVKGNGTVSFALTTPSSTSRTFAAREDASYRPQLIVEERPHLAGAQLHPLWGGTTPADYDRELDAAKAAGLDTVRMDLGWSAIEHAGKGQYAQWYVDKADVFFAHAKARGLKVIATLWSTPCWASTAPADVKQGCEGAWWDRGVERYAPANPGDYADFAAWVTRRWGASLHALEVWNEPNYDAFFKSPDPARDYAAMLKAAYPRVKAARPSLTVLGGSLLYSDGDFLWDLYEHGVKGSFDGLAYHPYSGGRDPDDVTTPIAHDRSYQLGTKWLRDIMVAKGDSARGMWITEVGFPTCAPEVMAWCVTADKQAEYTADNYRIAHQKWPFVKSVITYNLRDRGTNPNSFEDNMGLLRRDFSAKPGYHALKAELAR